MTDITPERVRAWLRLEEYAVEYSKPKNDPRLTEKAKQLAKHYQINCADLAHAYLEMAAKVEELERTPSPVTIRAGETVRVRGWFDPGGTQSEAMRLVSEQQILDIKKAKAEDE